ncbi:MAG: response regulator [Pseudomonadota bacterium]
MAAETLRDAQTILIVDDTPRNLAPVITVLEERGYQVAVAQDGEEGLARARLIQPDLILLDIRLPGADGFSVCRELKADPATRDIPVIFMTALSHGEHKVQGFAAGGVDYLTKPLHLEEVLARVATHLRLGAALADLEKRNAQLDQSRLELERRVEERTAQLRDMAAQRELALDLERKRIAREIHDELGQILTALKLGISTLRLQFGAANPGLGERVRDLLGLADKSIQVVRNVAGSLRPAALDMGICPALEWLAEQFERHAGIPCLLSLPAHPEPLDESRATTLFRVAQEALTNVARHAQAGQVEMELAVEPSGACRLVIHDDGQGFELRHGAQGFGLLGMRERVNGLGGRLDIASRHGGGTRIQASLPAPGNGGTGS